MDATGTGPTKSRHPITGRDARSDGVDNVRVIGRSSWATAVSAAHRPRQSPTLSGIWSPAVDTGVTA
jgi:hypothetical protein